MIRIAVCDDEKKILDEVSEYINSYAEKKNITDIEIFTFDSARALLGAIEDAKAFDIFILDVYIGDEIGTQLARDIRKLGSESPIIFTLGLKFLIRFASVKPEIPANSISQIKTSHPFSFANSTASSVFVKVPITASGNI